jgi:hypothetical protein
MSDWKQYEKLAEQIFRELSPTAEIKWNDSLYGYDSETYRQIDVSIRAALEGFTSLAIVQARDRTTPADINSVGEFASVVQDVRATKGILICKAGFTSSARTYARNLGIELLNAHDAQSHNWRLDIQIPILWIEEGPQVKFEMQFTLADETTIPLDERDAPILSQDQEKTAVDILLSIEALWNERRIPRTTGELHVIDFPGPLYMLTKDKQAETKWIPVLKTRVVYEVERRAWLGYFAPNECRGILNYLDNDSFIVSYLPVGEIPVRRPDTWKEIDDPDKVVVSTKGTIVVTEGITIKYSSGPFSTSFERIT